MSAPTQPACLLDQRRRHTAKVLLGVALVLAAVGLVLTSPARRATAGVEQTVGPSHHAASLQPSPELSPRSRSTVEAFLGGFLQYLYGRAPTSAVTDTTSAFLRSLEHQRLRVPPGMRSRHPRIVALDAAPAPPGMLAATALITDEEDVEYRIAVVLASSQGRELVAGLEER